MKLKRIFAAVIAGVVSASMMGIGASAYNETYYIYMNNLGVNTSFSKQVTLAISNPSFTINYFVKDLSTGYLSISNSYSSSLAWSYSYQIHAPKTVNYSIPWQSMGNKVVISASLDNLAPAGNYQSYGTFVG